MLVVNDGRERLAAITKLHLYRMGEGGRIEKCGIFKGKEHF